MYDRPLFCVGVRCDMECKYASETVCLLAVAVVKCVAVASDGNEWVGERGGGGLTTCRSQGFLVHGSVQYNTAIDTYTQVCRCMLQPTRAGYNL